MNRNLDGGVDTYYNETILIKDFLRVLIITGNMAVCIQKHAMLKINRGF